MNKKFSRSALAASIAAALLLDAASAFAEIEEVKVTARKKEESILQVPVTTTAISTETLEQYAIHDVKGIANEVPGLNFSNGPLSSGVLVSLRGIGTASNNPLMDQSVALVADGMQFTQGLAFGAAMFDLAQVEVLKGPQALFFGKAAPGGVITVRSQDPSDKFETNVQVGYETEAKEKQTQLIVSGPVTDALGLRLAAQYSEMEGYFKNKAVAANNLLLALPVADGGTGSASMGGATPTHSRFPEQQNVMLKGTVVWEPSDSFKARLKLNYSDLDSQGSGGEPQIVSCPDGTRSTFIQDFLAGGDPSLGIPSYLTGDDCKLDKTFHYLAADPAFFRNITNNGQPYSMLRQDFGSLELNKDFDNHLSLTSVTGFYDVKSSSLINPGLTSSLGAPFMIEGELNRHDYTQELRLTSDFDGALNFTAGLFYEKGRTGYFSSLPNNQSFRNFVEPNLLNNDPRTCILPYGVAWNGTDNCASVGGIWGDRWPNYTLGTTLHVVDVETKSVFGQTLWKFAPDFELGVGARWTQEIRADNATVYTDAINEATDQSGNPLGVYKLQLAKPEIVSNNWSPEISLTYTPTTDLTIFGNVKQAYKSGSYDVAGGFHNGEDASFNDERVRGGEIGVKSRLFDNTVAMNAAVYYYKYNDMQVESDVFDPARGVAGVRTINAASSIVRGVDFDITFAPSAIDGLTLNAALNWNKARYDDFSNAHCYSGQTIDQGCNMGEIIYPRKIDANSKTWPGYAAQDLSGKPLLRAPEWTGNFGINYRMPILDEMALRFGTNTTFSSSYYASSTDAPSTIQSGYQKTSANIGLVGPNERWTLELIGDNIFDKLTYGNCSPQSYADTLIFGKAIAGTGYPYNQTLPAGLDPWPHSQPGGQLNNFGQGAPAGSDVYGGSAENACFVERGRSVTLRLTVKLGS